MDTLRIFNHELFGDIRTMNNEKGETFFVGKDVAKALGYSKPENAIAMHVDSDDKTTTLIQGTGSNYKSKVVIINESGLYALVLSSKLEQARVFKRWVTSDVLPQIRKTGAYMFQRKQIEDLTRHIEEMEPKAEYMLYADYSRKGYAKSRTHSHRDAEGDLHPRTYLVWTEEGRRFVHRICRDEEVVI